MMVRGKGVLLLISVLLLASWTPLVPPALNPSDSSETEGRATTTWSGTMTLTSDYTVAAGDTLIIDAGATISFDDYVRLYVEGELDVTGTASSPATITRSGDSIAHEGIQFNATSRGRGSVIEHLLIARVAAARPHGERTRRPSGLKTDHRKFDLAGQLVF